MYNFSVKSSIHDYEVEFISNLKEVLEIELREGDCIIVDRIIYDLYFVEKNLISEKCQYITIDASESLKSYGGVIPIIQLLIERGFRKNYRLIAIGGGITQDVTAFIASILYRGVSWIFFPTTLLAQGDSCIGSKTSINFYNNKNLIGGFYPPKKIFIHTDFLRTLSNTEIKSGLGEILHYYVVSGESDFRMFESTYKLAINEKDFLLKIIARSLQIKRSYVEKDEFDENIRQVFNYGHSFGHAIESLTNYEIPHGIAICFGMDIANYISVKMGFLQEHVRTEIRSVTETLCEGYTIKHLNWQDMLSALGKDKKNVGGFLGLILNRGYGEVFKHLVAPDTIFKSWLEDYFREISNENL